MQKVKNLRPAGALMLVSWILLLIFAVQWLMTHYRAEKETLREELDRQFSEARAQVMDSTLMFNLIDPILKYQGKLKYTFYQSDSGINLADTLSKKHSVIQIGNNPSPQSMVCRISITDSGADKKLNHIGFFRNDTGNITLHSIRLLVGQAIDTTTGHSVIRKMLPLDIDTILLRTLFTGKMKKRGLDFTLRWNMNDTGKSVLVNKSAIVLKGKIFDGSVDASIGKYSWYLIKQITPQIGFAMFLLIITGGAFVFTYRSLKKQVMLNNLRNEFISNITHELKTPVATIKVALESLRNFDMKSKPEVAGDYLDMASVEMNRLDRLISKVLNISLLEEDKHILDLRVAGLRSMTERVIRTMSPRLEQEQAVLTFVAPDDDCMCLLDELFAEGVLLNLIDNSLKYSGKNARIDILLTEERQQVTLRVRDHGPGIPEPYISRVFDKFFRVPTGDRHNIKGHGLGLSYAFQVMKQHGGSIMVENCEGGGCEFTLTFPRG